MRNLARVVKTSQNTKNVTILPLYSSACINCLSMLNCTKNLKLLKAVNKKNFQIAEGYIVKVELPLFFKIATGIFALFFPIILAVVGYFVSPVACDFFNLETKELLRFICSALFLLFGESLVFFLSRMNVDLVSPEITQIL